MIQITNLTKKYKEKIAVNNINLTIKEGELFALLGTNGAGKTTTIKMLSTLILPTEGEIKIAGYDIAKDSVKIKEIVNVSPQETAIAPNLTVKENLDFMAGVYKIKNKNEKIDKLVKTFKLQEVLKQKAKTLSGGWQRNSNFFNKWSEGIVLRRTNTWTWCTCKKRVMDSDRVTKRNNNNNINNSLYGRGRKFIWQSRNNG